MFETIHSIHNLKELLARHFILKLMVGFITQIP
jgi:hypothetical protein